SLYTDEHPLRGYPFASLRMTTRRPSCRLSSRTAPSHTLHVMTAQPSLTLVTSHPRIAADRVDRNPGMPLDLDIVRAIRVNRSGEERGHARMPHRATGK